MVGVVGSSPIAPTKLSRCTRQVHAGPKRPLRILFAIRSIRLREAVKQAGIFTKDLFREQKQTRY